MDKNIFQITKVKRSLAHYIIYGRCIRGEFSKNDKIIIKENNCDILEGQIDKIKTYDKIEISSTDVDPDNNMILYLYIENQNVEVDINKKQIITKANA